MSTCNKKLFKFNSNVKSFGIRLMKYLLLRKSEVSLE